MRIARIIPIRAHMEAATARHAAAAAKETACLKRSIYAAAPSAAPPDLYEGSRTDRQPYPSPVSHLTKEELEAEGVLDFEDKDLPSDVYPLRSDPSTNTSHPDKADFQAAEDASHTKWPAHTDPHEVSSAGDPNLPIEEAKRREQELREQALQQQQQ